MCRDSVGKKAGAVAPEDFSQRIENWRENQVKIV